MISKVDFVPGDTVRVHERIKEGEKSRLQVFEGVVVGFKNRGDNRSFRVLKTVGGIWIEKIYPLKSVNVEKVDIKAHSKKKIRRAKLNYLHVTS